MIGFYRYLALLTVIMLFQKPVLSETSLYQFALYTSKSMDDTQCALVERFSRSKDQMLRFDGVTHEYGCNVYIPIRRYRKKFQFCFQSGINLYKLSPHSSFECFVQERENDVWFLAHLSGSVDPDEQIMCYFSCIGDEADEKSPMDGKQNQ